MKFSSAEAAAAQYSYNKEQTEPHAHLLFMLSMQVSRMISTCTMPVQFCSAVTNAAQHPYETNQTNKSPCTPVVHAVHADEQDGQHMHAANSVQQHSACCRPATIQRRTIKPPCTPVGHANEQDVVQSVHTVDLGQQLVHNRVVRSSAIPHAAALAADGVNLVKDDDVQLLHVASSAARKWA
jgi:hypothetical protein